jgi:hypothetical protein
MDPRPNYLPGSRACFENLTASWGPEPSATVSFSWIRILAGALPITYETFLSNGKGDNKRTDMFMGG